MLLFFTNTQMGLPLTQCVSLRWEPCVTKMGAMYHQHGSHVSLTWEPRVTNMGAMCQSLYLILHYSEIYTKYNI